jgi:hypothetical protein
VVVVDADAAQIDMQGLEQPFLVGHAQFCDQPVADVFVRAVVGRCPVGRATVDGCQYPFT